jgi:hypothetical protein
LIGTGGMCFRPSSHFQSQASAGNELFRSHSESLCQLRQLKHVSLRFPRFDSVQPRLRQASLPRESWLTQRPAHSEFADGIAESGQFVVAFHHGTISTWQKRFCNAGRSTASKPAQVTLPQDEHILLAAADRIPLDAQFMEPLGVEIEVEARIFANRFEAAEYLHNRFAPAGLTDIERDSGLWAWLSLFYFDAVCPPGKGGVRKPGALARHIPEPGNFQRYYRHLLAGPYRIYRAHRENPRRALALLCQPLNSSGDVVEQLASRQEVVTNPGILELATRLYVDSRTQRLNAAQGESPAGQPAGFTMCWSSLI